MIEINWRKLMWQLFNFIFEISRIIVRKGQREKYVESIKRFENNFFIYFSDEHHVNKSHQAAVLRHRCQYAVPKAFQKVVTSYDLFLKENKTENHLSLTTIRKANFTYFQILYFFHYSTVTQKKSLFKKKAAREIKFKIGSAKFQRQMVGKGSTKLIFFVN